MKRRHPWLHRLAWLRRNRCSLLLAWLCVIILINPILVSRPGAKSLAVGLVVVLMLATWALRVREFSPFDFRLSLPRRSWKVKAGGGESGATGSGRAVLHAHPQTTGNGRLRRLHWNSRDCMGAAAPSSTRTRRVGLGPFSFAAPLSDLFLKR